ncbi:MAG: hypothetical protein MUE54_02145 [Anaerolineae bacterium]|nr:hypothetical protein [Anaerolineae bacterium]
MNDKNKQNSTIVIWLAAMVISIFVLMNADLLGSWVIAALAMPMGLAFLSTAVVWNTHSSNMNNTLMTQRSGKSNDNTAYNMALLMEMMDDDEREEFKSQLKRRILSGETVTDESIVADIEKRKRG